MTARIGAADRRSAMALRQALPAALAVALLLWLALVAGRGALLALQTAGIPIAGEAQRTHATPPVMLAAAVVYLLCLVAALATRALRPTATLPVTYTAGAAVVLAGAIATGSSGSLAVVLVMVALALLIGQAMLRRLPATAAVPLVRLPIAFGLGLGVIGLLLFLFATFTLVNAVTVIGGGALILVFLVATDHQRPTQEGLRLLAWRPATPTWFETVVTGMAVGLVAFALLAAFVPENTSDAMRQHLPIAREIWQTGSASEFPPMAVSRDPIQGHLLYAVAWGFGGMSGAKLVHAMVGLATIAAVAGVGWLNAGRVAAVVGAVVFATMPVVLWELGHAFLDLFPIFFTATSLLCVLVWQRDGNRGWLVCAGALAGFGFAAKVTMGWMAVALAAALFLVGRQPWGWRDRVLAVTAFALGAVVIVPWLLRGYAISGSIPYISVLFDRLPGIVPSPGISVDPGAVNPQPPQIAANDGALGPAAIQTTGDGPGRSLFDLLRSPWDLTFQGERYGFPIIGPGEIGIALLMLLPLALFAPRTRAVALLAVTAVVSYMGWWFTPFQIARHLLPTLAIIAALAGIGVARLIVAGPVGTRHTLARAAQVGVVVGCLVVPVLFLPNDRTQLPVDLLIGRETAAEYVAREIPIAAVFAASDSLPPDTRVGYIGSEWEGAQIYTEARLAMDVTTPLPGTTPEEILATLERREVDYFIWNRPATSSQVWRSPLLSLSFLRDHTRILAGSDGGYLFGIRAHNGAGWGVGEANLLRDPDFARIDTDGPWTTAGRVRAKRGVIAMQPMSSVAQRVAVVGGDPYLLVASGQCANPDDRAELVLRWFDTDGIELGVVAESVFPGIVQDEQFLWQRAPDRAALASAELTASRGSRCEFDAITLHLSS